MRSDSTISIKKLFVVTLILKVCFSGIGWAIDDPWIFGFFLPLGVMMLYIIVGLRRKKREISDEKFADTCYYLGFIFTITSIIFSLFDLPQIGTRMTAIAVRFGAAMVSTVLGLGVRVYVVSFRRDLEDAVRSAEEELIEAFGRLRERAAVTFEKLAAFETRVDAAANASIARVQGGVEQLTQSYGETLTSFFSTLTESNHKAFQASLGEVRQSSLNLAKSVEVYSGAMQGNLQSLEGKVTQFAEVITRRLAQTTFPDDYFAERLAKPLEALGHSTMGIARQVDHAAANVDQAANSLRTGLATLQARAGDVEGALDQVVTLASSQKALLAGSQAQVDTLSVLSDTLRATQEGLSALSAQVSAQTGTLGQNAVAAATQTATIGNVTTTLQTLETALRTTIPLLERQQQSLAVATRESGSQNAHMGEIGHCLNDLSLSLRQVATSVEQNSRNLGTLVQQVAETNAVAQSARARDEGIAQKLAATQQESASLNQGVAQVSAQLAGLTRDLQAFVRETASLTQRLGALKVKVQLVDPPDRRSIADDSDRGAPSDGHATSAAAPAIAKPAPR